MFNLRIMPSRNNYLILRPLMILCRDLWRKKIIDNNSLKNLKNKVKIINFLKVDFKGSKIKNRKFLIMNNL